MKRMLVALTVAATLALGLTIHVRAQATINSTTLGSAVTSTSVRVITVASATSIAVGQIAYVDHEAMLIDTINGTQLGVTRGWNSTRAATHGSGAVVWTGPPNYFSMSVNHAGTCTLANQTSTPQINMATGDIYQCASGYWVKNATNGLPDFGPLTLLGAQGSASMTYTASGAITIQPGVQFLNGTTLAMTLANPTTAQNGMSMVIIATNASAHTITYTAGFNGGTTARDVATFGGAIGDNLVIFANNGVWWVVSTRNVTFG